MAEDLNPVQWKACGKFPIQSGASSSRELCLPSSIAPRSGWRIFNVQKVDKQIVEDLQPFQEEGINITRLYERGGELFSRVSFIHYSIVDSKVSNNMHVPVGAVMMRLIG